MSTSQLKVVVAPGMPYRTHTPAGDCLVSMVLKGISAIIKALADLISYFDLVLRNGINQELKKNKANLESH